jgi:hypothetical protein
MELKKKPVREIVDIPNGGEVALIDDVLKKSKIDLTVK